MKNLIIPMLLVGGFVALTTKEASAVIYCAAGVYRAGCVARPVVVAPRAVVVATHDVDGGGFGRHRLDRAPRLSGPAIPAARRGAARAQEAGARRA